MGRPSSYSDEIADRICQRLAKGEPLARICDDDDMPSYMAVWRWEKANEEFRELSAYAREIGTHHIADDCLNIADDPTLEPQDKRVRIDTRLRLIGKWNAKRYGDAVQMKHTDADGGPVQQVIRWAQTDSEATHDPSK